MKQACAGKARRILKGREKLWVNPPPGGEGKALLRLAHRANRPQTLNLISGLLENATSFVLMGTTLNRVPEVIIVLSCCARSALYPLAEVRGFTASTVSLRALCFHAGRAPDFFTVEIYKTPRSNRTVRGASEATLCTSSLRYAPRR